MGQEHLQFGSYLRPKGLTFRHYKVNSSKRLLHLLTTMATANVGND